MKTIYKNTDLELIRGRNFNSECSELNGTEKLSPREYEILKLLAQGCTNKEIAKILYVSVHTVKSNIEAILRILDAKNRTNTVYIAMKNNLIK